MTSKAWYKPSTLPQLVAKFQEPRQSLSKKSIEIWTTTCIVTNFGMQRRGRNPATEVTEAVATQLLPRCSMLINPANPSLTGPHSFPYFPRGGPQPESQPNRTAHHIMGYVSQWGGMDVGSGMLFPAAVIDGLVHQLGGKQLQNECDNFPKHTLLYAYNNQQSTPHETSESGSTIKCPVGTAVRTSAGGEGLRAEYDNIIHTVPPFYKYPPLQTKELKEVLLGIDAAESVLDEETWCYELLKSCYRHSFQLAFDSMQRNNTHDYGVLGSLFESIGLGKQQQHLMPENQRVAVPLLGAGCRGFPTSAALNAAASESLSWLASSNNENVSDDTMTKQSSTTQIKSVVAFGLLETSDAEQLATSISESL